MTALAVHPICRRCGGSGTIPDPFGDDRRVPCNCTETEEPTVDDRAREIADSMARLIELLVQRLPSADGRYAALIAAAERAEAFILGEYEGPAGIRGPAASVHADLAAAIRRVKGGAS